MGDTRYTKGGADMRQNSLCPTPPRAHLTHLEPTHDTQLVQYLGTLPIQARDCSKHGGLKYPPLQAKTFDQPCFVKQKKGVNKFARAWAKEKKTKKRFTL